MLILVPDAALPFDPQHAGALHGHLRLPHDGGLLAPIFGTARSNASHRESRGPTAEIPLLPLPGFARSGWFILLCAIVAQAVSCFCHAARMHGLARRLRRRLNDQLIEHERIAHDIHDSLLQNVQGLVLHFQSIANRMPAGEAARSEMEAALGRADQVLLEGRNNIRGLRPPDAPGDLCALITRRFVAEGPYPAVALNARSEGTQRPLIPLAKAELAYIAGEILIDIARHAPASPTSVVVRYERSRLSMRLTGADIGIAPEILVRGGLDRHDEITEMRERADQIGASLAFGRDPKNGTVVIVTVPAHFAYADHRPGRWPWWPRVAPLSGRNDG